MQSGAQVLAQDLGAELAQAAGTEEPLAALRVTVAAPVITQITRIPQPTPEVLPRRERGDAQGRPLDLQLDHMCRCLGVFKAL